MSTYQGMHDSNIVFGFMTPAVREPAGLRKKILYCDFFQKNSYTPYDDAVVFRLNSYSPFAERLDKLFAQSYKEYLQETGPTLKNLMQFDLNNSPSFQIKTIILETVRNKTYR